MVEIEYCVMECGNRGRSEVPSPFPTLSAAVDFAKRAQKQADAGGNRAEVTYHVIPKGKVVFSTRSRFA